MKPEIMGYYIIRKISPLPEYGLHWLTDDQTELVLPTDIQQQCVYKVVTPLQLIVAGSDLTSVNKE